MRYATVLTALILLPVTAALADVYRSVDAQGHLQYSDTPTAGAELVSIRGMRNAPAPVRAADSGKTKSYAEQQREQQTAQQTQTAAKQAVQKDVAQTRAEQCKQAQDTYQKSIQARLIYKTDKDGQRTYLSESDADQTRLNARIEMESVCKSTP